MIRQPDEKKKIPHVEFIAHFRNGTVRNLSISDQQMELTKEELMNTIFSLKELISKLTSLISLDDKYYRTSGHIKNTAESFFEDFIEILKEKKILLDVKKISLMILTFNNEGDFPCHNEVCRALKMTRPTFRKVLKFMVEIELVKEYPNGNEKQLEMTDIGKELVLRI